jgi:peptidoglycan/LPS O-acetylase OafA/YrhL
LDGIRGLAVLWVFAFHANALLAGGLVGPAAGWGQSLAEKGLLGVQLFFLLSGFLLAQAWIRADALGLAPPRLGPFLARRARRILPAYWFHLALLFGVVLPLLQGGFAVLHTAVGQASLILHPLLLQFAHPGTSSSLGINMALWSLTIEAQFYLLLPLLAPLFTGRRVLVALPLTLALSLAWKGLAPGLLADWIVLHVPPSLLVFFDPVSGRPTPFPPEAMALFIERQLPGEIAAFGLGMAVANLFWRWNPEQMQGNGVTQPPKGCALDRWLDWGALGSVALAAWTLAVLPFETVMTGAAWRNLGMPLFLMGSAVLVLAAARETPVVRRLLGGPLLAIPGVISYSFYLWHEPLIRLVRQGMGISADNQGILGADCEAQGCAIALALGASLAIAALSYRAVERPFWGPSNPPCKDKRCDSATVQPSTAPE